MKHFTTRVRAAIGAAMIVAFAVPAAAQNPQPPARARAEAQWLDGVRWQRMGGRRMATMAWRRGYVRGYARGWESARLRAWRGYARAVPRGRLHARVRVAPWGARIMWRRPI